MKNTWVSLSDWLSSIKLVHHCISSSSLCYFCIIRFLIKEFLQISVTIYSEVQSISIHFNTKSRVYLNSYITRLKRWNREMSQRVCTEKMPQKSRIFLIINFCLFSHAIQLSLTHLQLFQDTPCFAFIQAVSSCEDPVISN